MTQVCDTHAVSTNGGPQPLKTIDMEARLIISWAIPRGPPPNAVQGPCRGGVLASLVWGRAPGFAAVATYGRVTRRGECPADSVQLENRSLQTPNPQMCDNNLPGYLLALLACHSFVHQHGLCCCEKKAKSKKQYAAKLM